MKNILFVLGLSAMAIFPKAFASDRCEKFTVVAHRGLSGRAPEESKLAFEMAAVLSPDYLEMDVHRTKDGVLIVNHDNDFSRTTNIAKVYPERIKDSVSKFTFAEIEKLETGTWFNQKYPQFEQKRFVGAGIIKLEEVIHIALDAPSHPGLYIETKSPELYSGIEKEIVELLEREGAFAKLKVIFQSFDAESLTRFNALKPDVPRVYLSEAPYEKLDEDLKIASHHGSGIGPDYDEMKKDRLQIFIKKVHDLNLTVHFYTVNDMESLVRLIYAGADGVFTNRADLLVQACGRIKKAKIEALLSYPKHKSGK